VKVGIFYTSITNWSQSPPKIAVMKDFGQGVKACGDMIEEFKDSYKKISQIDAAFILGYAHAGARFNLIQSLVKKNIPIIYIDSDIFVYGKAAVKCYRYSVNGIFPSDGEYFLHLPYDRQKTVRILELHNIRMKPWRQNGSHILILGQRTHGWNMLGNNGLSWIIETIKKIKQYTDRPVVVRLHPGDQDNKSNMQKIKNIFNDSVQISRSDNLLTDLNNAWCSVGYSSTPNCASIIEGIPVYLDRPDISWAKDMAFTDLSKIEKPTMNDRDLWINKIAHIHYMDDEIISGVYWKRYKDFYSTL